jgi:hypothetical protein
MYKFYVVIFHMPCDMSLKITLYMTTLKHLILLRLKKSSGVNMFTSFLYYSKEGCFAKTFKILIIVVLMHSIIVKLKKL